MSSSFDLNAILSQIGRDKGIDKGVLIEAIESAMLSAARRHYGHHLNLETKFNEETGEIEVLQFKTVVEQFTDEGTQLSLEEARRDYDPEAMVGDEFGKKLGTEVLGRIAAQTAKQVIIQKVRDAERSVIFDEYKNSKGELINGIVQRYDKGNVIVNLGRTEAMLPKREQIARERYRQGDRVRCMILDIDPTARGPQIILTRSHPDFLRKLFGLEVPEIAEGVIEIREVAREPGERAKIAVHSKDSNIDPVGACVGIKGSRVQAVVQELRGERIDIITWTPDEPSFVARALSPADVSRVVVDEDAHSMEVIVNDDQLSLAIGRKGQNVKLASKLTGWRIDVRSVSVAEEQAKRARQSLEAIPNLDFTDAELLFQHGFRNAREVAESTIEDLLEVQGFSEEKANLVLESSRDYVRDLEERGAMGEDGTVHELQKLGIRDESREKLLNAGKTDIQKLVETPHEELVTILGDEEEAFSVRETVDLFLKGGAALLR
jgi:transcription termination/antitermination protein NusA